MRFIFLSATVLLCVVSFPDRAYAQELPPTEALPPLTAPLPPVTAPLPPSLVAAPTPQLPEWISLLSVHAMAGLLDHGLDASDSRAPAGIVGLGFRVDRFARLEVEVMRSSASRPIVCPVIGECTPSNEPTRLNTVLYGFRLETPSKPLSAFFGGHNGIELEGRYKVFDLQVGGRLALGDAAGVRVEARYRWDDRFFTRGPVGGALFMVGVDLRGGVTSHE